MSRSRLIIVTVIAAFALGMNPASGRAQPATAQRAQRLSRKELKVLIANARTPEEHERIASWYRADAARLKAQQNEHEKEAQEYFKNPSSHPIPKWPTYGQHCKELAAYYDSQTRKELALADVHEQLAKGTGKSTTE